MFAIAAGCIHSGEIMIFNWIL